MILHKVGCDATEIESSALFTFAQVAFKLQSKAHEAHLKAAKAKKARDFKLKVEIVEAKELAAMDSNGLADPFVTLYMASAPNRRYTSSFKTKTLNPIYEEQFDLYV